MFDNNIFKIVDSVASEDQIVNINTKVLSLNFFQNQLNELESERVSEKLKAKIAALKQVLDDTYELDVYKFQFKVLTEILAKEIADIQQEIAFGNN